MHAMVDHRSLWIAGNVLEVMERLRSLCHLYGENTSLVDLLRLLQQ